MARGPDSGPWPQIENPETPPMDALPPAENPIKTLLPTTKCRIRKPELLFLNVLRHTF
jgi:hypothetical protein